MHIVEVFSDGTEEQLEQGMELDTNAVEEDANAALPATSGSSSSSSSSSSSKMPAKPAVKPQPLVKLLQCKAVNEVPQPPPNLMLWVDGCLAPALHRPLFIDLQAANNPLAQTAGPSPANSSSGSAKPPPPLMSIAIPDNDDDEMVATIADGASSFREGSISPAVSAIAAAAVRGAARARFGVQHEASWPQPHSRFAAVHSPIGEEDDELHAGPRVSNTSSTQELGAHPPALAASVTRSSSAGAEDGLPMRASSTGPEHTTARSSSVELCPPVLGNNKSPCVKRTRPASACAGCSSLSSEQPMLARSESLGGSVLGLSEVMCDWQLESPSKRPALSPAPDRLLSPPTLSNGSGLAPGAPTARPAAARPIPPARPPTATSTHPPSTSTHVTSPAALRGGRGLTINAIGPPPLASSTWQQPKPGPHTPPSTPCHPTAISAATGGMRTPFAAVRTSSSGGMSAAFAAIQATPTNGGATVGSGASAVAPSTSATPMPSVAEEPAAAPSTSATPMPSVAEEPAAPPPSPVLGPRPTAREVFGTTKRKQRDDDVPSLSRVESELDALKLGQRPSKLVRCAPLS